MIILGGSGFVGRHLSHALALAGHPVIEVARTRTMATPVNGIQRIICDATDLSGISSILEAGSVLISTLPSTTPLDEDSNPIFDSPAYIRQLLQRAEESGVRHFFYCSSGGAVYGQQDVDKYSETMPLSPVSNYGKAKANAESQINNFCYDNMLNATSLRFSNLFGIGHKQNSGQGLISIALKKISTNSPVEIYGDGTMVRDYLSVEDASRAVASMASLPILADSYNIGSGVGYSVNEVISVIEKSTGFRCKKRPVAVPDSFVRHSVLDTTRLQRLLGRFHVQPFEYALRKFIRHELSKDLR